MDIDSARAATSHLGIKNLAIIQARMSSTRLPGKVMAPINGVPSIIYQLNRVSKATSIDKVILATSTSLEDDVLSDAVSNAGFLVFRGPLDDVLLRFYRCSQQEHAQNIVRITGDCPFTDPQLIDEIVTEFEDGNWDYLANNWHSDELSVPDGFDLEVFKACHLDMALSDQLSLSDKEHVTPWFKRPNQDLRVGHYCHKKVFPYYRLTVDDPIDLIVARTIASGVNSSDTIIGIGSIVDFLVDHPEVADLNISTPRNLGYSLSLERDNETDVLMEAGPKLWKRAKQIIPGGNMLLSKRAEMFLPGKWPSYYSRAKGCAIWDLNGNRFIDMCIMGIGTNILGYCHPEVDATVHRVVSQGNMSTLNCAEEVKLAELLVSLHPWSDMVRFARTGGEANSIAIRVARAATGRETVAVCGYHGWHDWYLATNLSRTNGLDEHLLPGLDPGGVPASLRGTTVSFEYNQLDQLKSLIRDEDLAAVIMEVRRNTPPSPHFLQSVRQLCSDNGIVLIFDECTSGFRECLGGLHLNYGVEPDIAMFGKAIGNGYAITAIIGRRSVMEYAQSTFISSTFWTERIGPSAALTTLDVMSRDQSWVTITELGTKMQQGWRDLAALHNLPLTVVGIPSLSAFSIQSANWLKYKTLVTQEMLQRGYLASNLFYPSTSHTDTAINDYLCELDEIFNLIAQCEDGHPVEAFLTGETCHSSFKRLT